MLKAGNAERYRELDWQDWSRRWGHWSEWRANHSSAQMRNIMAKNRQDGLFHDRVPAFDERSASGSPRSRRRQKLLASIHASASAWLKQMKFMNS